MTDDDLRNQLRQADPASSLPPLTDEDAARLLATAMQTGTGTGAPAKKPIGMRRSLALVAAAAALFAGVRGLERNARRIDAPAADRRPGRRGRHRSGGQVRGPVAQELRGADLAVEGTVRSVRDGVATLTISRVWAGAEVGVLEVNQGAASMFQAGQVYLVAVRDGEVRGCGCSGLRTAELRALFDAAFS